MAEPNDFAGFLPTLGRRIETLEKKAEIKQPNLTPYLEAHAQYIVDLENRVKALEPQHYTPPHLPDLGVTKGTTVLGPDLEPHIILHRRPSAVTFDIAGLSATITDDGFTIVNPKKITGTVGWSAAA